MSMKNEVLELKKELEPYTKDVLIFECDVSDEKRVYEVVKEAEDALAYHNISKGSRVNLSVSARNEDVDNLLTFLKDKNKVYNNSNNDTFVTVNLYNNIEVIETLDSNGQTVTYGKISQMIFKVPKAEVLLITNLRLYREIFYKSN